MIFCMTSLNTISPNMKLKLVKKIKNFVKFFELLGDRLEVCVSVFKLLCDPTMRAVLQCVQI